MPETAVSCTSLPGVTADISDSQRSKSRIVFGRTDSDVPPGKTGCPLVAYDGGNGKETTLLLNGTGTAGVAVICGENVNGVPAVRKLSCHRFGSMVVMAPAACSTV